MKKRMAACGNDCSICPRRMPKTDAELCKTAELWVRIGYREKLVSKEEIACCDCSVENWCRYEIVECVQRHQIKNCGQCPDYPCEKIQSAFVQAMRFEPQCKRCCTVEEYKTLRQAFFEKKRHLDEVSKTKK